MSAVAEIARLRAADLQPYRPGQPAGSSARKLSSNEAPLGACPAVSAALAAFSGEANRYPDAEPLRRQIAAQQRLTAAHVVVSSGSDELCYMLARLFVEPGSRVVLSDPCYAIDRLVTLIHGGRPTAVPLMADGSHDLDAIETAAVGAALIWLPSPHNPTGVASEPAALERLLDRVPADCVVVLDEAYRAYTEPDRRVDVAASLAAHPNLIVQRTLSKEYGLAGLRVGYGLAAPPVVEALNRIKAPFNVNAAAIVAARVALASQDWRAYGVAIVRRERRLLMDVLDRLGWHYFRSEANFVTFRAPSVERLKIALAEVDIVVRDGADLGLPGWVRVSVGSPPVMAELRRVLEGL